MKQDALDEAQTLAHLGSLGMGDHQRSGALVG